MEELSKQEGIKRYLDKKFGGIDQCKKAILGKLAIISQTFNSISYREYIADFFRGAFDGSGADNFYDAGSCIDGRLTSAWNCE